MLDPLIHRHFFCADLSRFVHESMYGTGGVTTIYALLEYPGGWESKAIADSTLSSEVKAYLSGLAKGPLKAKTLLIKQDRQPKHELTFFVVVVRESDPVIYQFKLERYEDLLKLDLAGIDSGQMPAGARRVVHPLFLICTHGRHDKCCAKFGYPTYKLMRTYYAEATWQVSHVGGDRFASNVICFPHGIYYGHVDHDDALQIIDGYRAGQMRMKNYRGRSCYSKEAQVAEYFLRTETGVEGIDRARLLEILPGEDKTFSVSFEVDGTDHFTVRVKRRASEFQNFMTCHAASRKTVAQYTLIEVEKLPVQS